MTLNAVNQARWARFCHNRRGYWSLWIFLVIFICSLGAELIANDRPLLVSYQGSLYVPVVKIYSEKTFGGEFATAADYQDPWLQQRLEKNGWVLWTPIRFGASSINFSTDVPFPSPPSRQNWLGTDANGRDVLARILYGTRISLLFGLILTICSSVMGVIVGAVQGYYGGRIDLWGQRFIEFLRTRNYDYIRAAQALGVGDRSIILRHMLPNAMVATLTFIPFILCSSITTLTSLDFLGFGLPLGSPSLGELLLQGKNNLQAPWLGIAAFLCVAVLLSLLIFIGEAVRDAFDPSKAV